MNTRRAALTIAAAAALSAALTGCNPMPDAGPITTATKTTTASPTPTASTSTTLDPAAKEAQDRQDAELVWRKFNALVNALESLPAEQVGAAINAVAVEPTVTRLREENAQFRAEHKAGYGQDILYISWPQPIDGKDTAVLRDCQDGSQAGVVDTKTGNKLTVGTPKTPMRGTLKRTAEGWKVATAEILEGTTCTPGM